MPGLAEAVVLSASEQEVVKLVARMRTASARSAGVRNARIGPQGDDLTDLDGFGAELAFAKHAGLYPDLTVGPRSGGADFILPSGISIDVKQSRHSRARLAATLKKAQDPCDIYVLVVGEMPRYWLMGWAAADELFLPRNIGDLGHGRGYLLPQDQLHTEDIFALAARW